VHVGTLFFTIIHILAMFKLWYASHSLLFVVGFNRFGRANEVAGAGLLHESRICERQIICSSQDDMIQEIHID